MRASMIGLCAAFCIAAAQAQPATPPNLPRGAVYSAAKGSLDIEFPDASAYHEDGAVISARGPQAVAWMLANVADDAQRLVRPEDMKAYFARRAGHSADAVEMEIEYADGSKYLRGPNGEGVTGPLASKYVALIREYERGRPASR